MNLNITRALTSGRMPGGWREVLPVPPPRALPEGRNAPHFARLQGNQWNIPLSWRLAASGGIDAPGGGGAHLPPAAGGSGNGSGKVGGKVKIVTAQNYVFTDAGHEAVLFAPQERILIRPMYHELEFSPRAEMYGRRAVYEGIQQALHFIPDEYGIVCWDVYRCRAVQGKLFEWMRGQIRERSPELSDDENYAEAKKYMSAPSKVGDAYCPPHLSGGAIDLTLFERSTGREVDMGTVFDDCTERAHSDYFAKKPSLTPAETLIHQRRTILATAMTNVGFTPYEFEWWHYDLGNIFWRRVTKRDAVFGPLYGDQEWPHP